MYPCLCSVADQVRLRSSQGNPGSQRHRCSAMRQILHMCSLESAHTGRTSSVGPPCHKLFVLYSIGQHAVLVPGTRKICRLDRSRHLARRFELSPLYGSASGLTTKMQSSETCASNWMSPPHRGIDRLHGKAEDARQTVLSASNMDVEPQSFGFA